MPLRVQMQLGLVDIDDPLATVVQCQGGQEQEQLELTGAEEIDFELMARGPARVDVERTTPRIRLLGSEDNPDLESLIRGRINSRQASLIARMTLE